jgi:hypothetical protein
MAFATSNSSMNQEDALVFYGLRDPDDVKTSKNINRLQSYSALNVGNRVNLASLVRDSEIASMDYRFNNTDIDGEVDDKTLLNHVNANALTKITKHLSNVSSNTQKSIINKKNFLAKTSKPRTGVRFAVDSQSRKFIDAQDLIGE